MAHARVAAFGATAKLTALAESQGRPLDLNAFTKNESLERTEMTQANRVIIFDTTLRDGEQSPGAAMTKEEKSASPASWKNWVWTSSKRVLPLPARAISRRSMRLRKPLPNQRSVHCPVPSSGTSVRRVRPLRPRRKTHPHLHRHQPHPYGVQIEDEAEAGD